MKVIYRKGTENKICVPASHSYYIADNEGIIGEFCLLFTGSIVSLWSFAIDPLQRGKGYGKAVLQLLISELRQQNRDKLVLYVKTDNIGAIKLYESVGFKVVPQGDSSSLYYELPLRHINCVTNLPHFAGKEYINIQL